tara:strand:+ start:233 stop:424 length:192 start_codon:yes stop_codon:yes gene_type:complete
MVDDLFFIKKDTTNSTINIIATNICITKEITLMGKEEITQIGVITKHIPVNNINKIYPIIIII